MNNYSLDNIYIGLKEKFEVDVNEQMMETFKNICGDINPMHRDEEYAIANGYSGRIVYGMLTASFFSTLVGVYLPGESCLFHQCDVMFPNPVYVGDHLTVCGEVKEIDKTFKRITIKAHVVNQQGKKVARAKLVAGIREE